MYRYMHELFCLPDQNNVEEQNTVTVPSGMTSVNLCPAQVPSCLSAICSLIQWDILQSSVTGNWSHPINPTQLRCLTMGLPQVPTSAKLLKACMMYLLVVCNFLLVSSVKVVQCEATDLMIVFLRCWFQYATLTSQVQESFIN